MKDLFIELLKVAISVIPMSYVCFLISVYIVRFGLGIISLIVKEEKLEKLRFPAMLLTTLYLVIEYIHTVHRDDLYYVCIIVLFVLLCVLIKWLYSMVVEYRTQNEKQKVYDAQSKAKPIEPVRPIPPTQTKPISIVSNAPMNILATEKKTVVHKNIVGDTINEKVNRSELNIGGFNYGRFEPNFITRSGDYVYSPVELFISCKLLDAGFSYEYFRKLQLEETITLIPSFTIKINKYGRRVFWEHFPSIKDEYNSNRWRLKKQLYETHNIALGRNLFLTTDDNFTFREIDECIAMIQKLLDPKECIGVNKDIYSTDDCYSIELRSIEEEIICDESSFLNYFLMDIATYTRRLIIFSPYMTEARTHMLLPFFDGAISQGKQIIVVTKDISCRNKEDRNKHRQIESTLITHGVHIVYRGDMHEKLIFVDNTAVWNGSLNALSFTGRTRENMHRHTDKRTVSYYTKMYQIGAIN